MILNEMTELLIMTLQFLTALCLIVFVHESGHFLAARAFGIHVKKFYLFFDAFGKRLFRFRIGGTEFGLGWLPLGGYVSMAGVGTDDETDDDPGVPLLSHFDQKPVWQRTVVMLSGILMNLLFALIIFSGLTLVYGRNQMAGIGSAMTIQPGDLGKDAGLRPGDQVSAINEDRLIYEDELFSTRLLQGNTILTVVRKRGKDRVHLHIAIPPRTMQQVAEKGFAQFYSIRAGFRLDSILTNLDLTKNKNFRNSRVIALNDDPVGSLNDFYIRLNSNKDRKLYLTVVRNGRTSILPAHLDKDGHLAFSLDQQAPKLPQVSLGRSVSAGAARAWDAVIANGAGLGQVLRGEISTKDAVFGPLRIASLFGDHYNSRRFWELMAILSLAIAMFNLLPLLPLDGGAVLLLAWEGLSRRPAPTWFLRTFQLGGMALVLLLTLFVLSNDIRHFFNNQ